jgi:hypothetical protein
MYTALAASIAPVHRQADRFDLLAESFDGSGNDDTKCFLHFYETTGE